jgi:tubulin--tyrosine ligase-like protein 12
MGDIILTNKESPRYVMDELGSALRHSDDPNFQVAPFMFLPDGTLKSAISYTLMWPIEDLGKGNECMRDYLFGVGEDKQRSSRLTAWFHTPPELFKQVGCSLFVRLF